jgi:hypothetical protein
VEDVPEPVAELKPEPEPAKPRPAPMAGNKTVDDEGDVEETLGSKLQKKATNDLTKALDINDRFLFINDLFKGNKEAFNTALAKLNGFDSLTAAKDYLTSLGQEYTWDEEEKAVIVLNKIIERRYS